LACFGPIVGTGNESEQEQVERVLTSVEDNRFLIDGMAKAPSTRISRSRGIHAQECIHRFNSKGSNAFTSPY
jgi:hypothetical protein